MNAPKAVTETIFSAQIFKSSNCSLFCRHMSRSLIIIGGGAAGFFCGVNAARLDPSLQITILEKSSKLLQKVKVSGGGRCNVTHACFEISTMVKRYPRGEQFLKKAFHHFFTTDTIAWFKERGVALKAEPDGRMFPVTDSSQTIIDCLLREAHTHHIDIQLNKDVTGLGQQEGRWLVHLRDGSQMQADMLCIACGGFPKKEQFSWITNFTGHQLAEPVPSLFTFNLPKHPITALMGVVVKEAAIKIAGSKLQSTGPVLVTHWGLSGPGILRLSAFAARELAAKNYAYTVIINWLPAFNENSLREKILQYRNSKGSQKVINTDWVELPQRMWQFLLEQSGAQPDVRWAALPAAVQNKLVKHLCSYEMQAQGKTTYKDEFVTAGGILLSEIDPNTMMSRKHANLFFAGEIIDVDGITGGYNFQNAWTTGFIAACSIAGAPGTRV